MNVKKYQKIFINVFVFLLALTPFLSYAQNSNKPATAALYYNEACAACAEWANNGLIPILNKNGVVNVIKKDYVNNKDYRREMNAKAEELGIPLDLQSHMMTFVKIGKERKDFIIAGHVPENLINEAFQNAGQYERLIIYQDIMRGDVKDYKVWMWRGGIQVNAITEPLLPYLNKASRLPKSKTALNANKNLLPLVLVSGFLDGFNPCAFAVLLFFIAFLFTIKRTRGNIIKTGLVYIAAIYLAYLAIGFGLMKAILFSNSPHLMAKIGAWLVVALGVINIINYFSPCFPIKLKIPKVSKSAIKEWIFKATLPAAFALGFLVGLCTFPCSGGIYVAIIGLLTARATYARGAGYLLLYNIMFVLPLLIILFGAFNTKITEKLARIEQSESRSMKFWSGAVMIALGVIILIWFV